eukprot:30939-Pelagococcus_subviridis.AAC.1
MYFCRVDCSQVITETTFCSISLGRVPRRRAPFGARVTARERLSPWCSASSRRRRLPRRCCGARLAVLFARARDASFRHLFLFVVVFAVGDIYLFSASPTSVRAAQGEQADAGQVHPRARPREEQPPVAREEAHRGDQEDGEAEPDGRGQGASRRRPALRGKRKSADSARRRVASSRRLTVRLSSPSLVRSFAPSSQVMAKDLVRTRHSITKFYGLKSQLQGVSLRMQTLKSTQAMADAMRGVTRAMASMNKQLNLPSLNNIMREFERQNEKMESTTEVMGDAIDDAMAADGEEEESEELVNQVLDELGCGLDASLVSAPTGGVKVAVVAERAEETPAR